MGAGRGGPWRRILAVVEWRSERKGQERPIALRRGRDRVFLQVERQWVEAGPEGGNPHRRVFLARAGSPRGGRLFRITLEDGGEILVEEWCQRGEQPCRPVH